MSWTWYPDPFFFLNKLFSSSEVGALGNGAGFNHADVDDLLNKALAVTDQDQRAEYYKQALELIVTYDPMFVYATEYVNTGMSSRAVSGSESTSPAPSCWTPRSSSATSPYQRSMSRFRRRS